MPFSNPVVGGSVLIRPAIQSPNYVAATSGWSINADGTAEFNNTTIRGSLIVTDPDGSYVRAYDENPGNGAVIDLKPANFAPYTITPGQIRTDTATGPDRGRLVLASPELNGAPPSLIALSTTQPAGTGDVTIATDTMELLTTDTISLSGPNGITANSNYIGCGQAGIAGQAVASGNDSTASTTYVNMAGTGGLVSFSFTKKYDNTDVKITMGGTVAANNTGAQYQYGVRINGVDYDVGRVYGTLAAANTRQAYNSFGYVGAAVLPAGTYTVRARWANASGVGTIFRDTLDWISIEAQEMP